MFLLLTLKKYWILQLCLAVDYIFNDMIRKILMSAKNVYALKTYMMFHIITSLCDFIFSQSEIEIGRGAKSPSSIQKRGPKSSTKKDDFIRLQILSNASYLN